jgi:hypothetical protein
MGLHPRNKNRPEFYLDSGGRPMIPSFCPKGKPVRRAYRFRQQGLGEPLTTNQWGAGGGSLPIESDGVVRTSRDACPATIAAVGVDKWWFARVDLEDGFAAADLARQALAASSAALVYHAWDSSHLGFRCIEYSHLSSRMAGQCLPPCSVIPPWGIREVYHTRCGLSRVAVYSYTFSSSRSAAAASASMSRAWSSSPSSSR